MTTQFRGVTYKRPHRGRVVPGKVAGNFRGHRFEQGRSKIDTAEAIRHGQYRGHPF
ncbi:MAG: hypothetical protein AB4040_04885 [Synechococcus sp.]